MATEIERLESAARLAMGSLDLPGCVSSEAPERRIAPCLFAAAIAAMERFARKLR